MIFFSNIYLFIEYACDGKVPSITATILKIFHSSQKTTEHISNHWIYIAFQECMIYVKVLNIYFMLIESFSEKLIFVYVHLFFFLILFST